MKNCIPIILAAGYGQRIRGFTRKIPKCFLEIHNKLLIEYTLDILISFGFKEVVIVVGYKNKLIQGRLGTLYKNLNIQYIFNNEYETTGHGYSLFLTKTLFIEDISTIIIHGDVFYEPSIIKELINDNCKNIITVDKNFSIITKDEIVVQGLNDRVYGLKKVSREINDIVGEVVGINKWSSELLKTYYFFASKFFNLNGKNYNWEPMVNKMLEEDKKIYIKYRDIEKQPWININYLEDYNEAKSSIYDDIYLK